MEIGWALTRSSSHPRAGEPLPIRTNFGTLLTDRLKPLSADARDALLVVAASPSPSADLVAAVAGSDIALEEAGQAEIVTMRGTSVVFTHPLLASAVYANAAPSTRRGVHERLAAVSTDLEQGHGISLCPRPVPTRKRLLRSTVPRSRLGHAALRRSLPS